MHGGCGVVRGCRAARGAIYSWAGAGALWRLTGFGASVGAGSLLSSVGREAVSLLATRAPRRCSMGAAAALEAVASEVTAVLIVVVWVRLACESWCRTRAGYSLLFFCFSGAKFQKPLHARPQGRHGFLQTNPTMRNLYTTP